jgi:hypothetical protein
MSFGPLNSGRRGVCVGLTVLGLAAIGYPGLRPRLVCDGPSAINAMAK